MKNTALFKTERVRSCVLLGEIYGCACLEDTYWTLHSGDTLSTLAGTIMSRISGNMRIMRRKTGGGGGGVNIS